MTQTIRYRTQDESQAFISELNRTLIACFLLAAVVFCLFAPAAFHVNPNKPEGRVYTGFEFINCDDDPYVESNENVRKGICWDTIRWSATTGHAANWHPLTWLSHALDCELYGPLLQYDQNGQLRPVPSLFSSKPNDLIPWTGGHHLTSILIHTASTVVLFLALQLMTGNFWCSLIAAAMFGVHPYRAESVAWIAERKDVLSAFFWILTMYAYGWYAKFRDDTWDSVWRYLAVVFFFACGLMCKSMLVTLPFVLLLLDYWPLKRLYIPFLSSNPNGDAPNAFAAAQLGAGGQRIVRKQPAQKAEPEQQYPVQSFGWLVLEKLPLLALSAIVCWIVMFYQKDTGAMDMTVKFPTVYHYANAALAAVLYLWKMIYPVGLSIFYPHPAILHLYNPAGLHTLVMQGIVCGVLLLLITACVIWGLRRHGYLAVGWFWYLGTLVPVIGIVQVGVQGMADRYTYLTMIGINIMVVWGVAELVKKSKQLQIAACVLAGVVLCVWIGFSSKQITTWENSVTVFEQAVKSHPNTSYFGYNHLGLAYLKPAQVLLDKNRVLSPQERAFHEANAKKAGDYFKQSTEITLAYDSSNGNLGVYYMNFKHDVPAAIECFKKAVGLNSCLASHHMNLAAAYLQNRQIDEAINTYEKGTETRPKEAILYYALSSTYIMNNRVAAAVATMQRAIKNVPNNEDMKLRLSWILATTDIPLIRNGKAAEDMVVPLLEKYRQDQKTVGLMVTAMRNLAAAYAAQSRYPEAVQVCKEALSIARQGRSEPLIKEFSEYLAIYQSKKPLIITKY